MLVDDDALGASLGDGDGLVDYGETIELTIGLHNMGHLDGLDVTALLQTQAAFSTIPQPDAFYPLIPAGEVAVNETPFVIHVTHDVPDQEMLPFTVAVSEDPSELFFDLVAQAPEYLVGAVVIDDSQGGNGNGIADPGETLDVTLQVENTGSSGTPDLTAVLQSATEHFATAGEPHDLGSIAPGTVAVEDGFVVSVAPSCPPIYTHQLRLVMTGPGWSAPYVAAPAFLFNVGSIFSDDMETGSASWTHYAGGSGWVDDWHLETRRNHTYAGQTSWKCGREGNLSYNPNNYALLETAPFDLPPGGRLEFWHWMKAEVSEIYPGYCFDGGRIEISTDGGATWTALEPEGGYPYRIRTASGQGPFPGETPVWSGSHDWTEVWVDLSGYDGAAQLRWAFGSNAAINKEGWYIDDVRVVVPPTSAVSAEQGSVIRPRLHPIAPNPLRSVNGGQASRPALIRYVLPTRSRVEIEVYDVTGRSVRRLLDGTVAAGEHRLVWDGCGGDGRPVSAGTYYCRLTVGPHRQTQRVTVVR